MYVIYWYNRYKRANDAVGQLVNNLDTAKRRNKIPGSYRKDGSQTERTQQMIFVNESGLYAQRKTYSTENQLVNTPVTAKRGFISAATCKKKVGTVAKHWCKLIFVNWSCPVRFPFLRKRSKSLTSRFTTSNFSTCHRMASRKFLIDLK